MFCGKPIYQKVIWDMSEKDMQLNEKIKIEETKEMLWTWAERN